ncbi:LuxR C-terminal-related transcriptional regulator [Actinomadura decatromicini]|uniref:AAA family ATPase n=1 Tax=Actinomadura decatromicini TaxID=2604572 RepID=A0A5D3FYE2_9ACTN|nr:LuxR C-terminal-related transcriptional regulator [Actinomadura decatromicini]TYK53042.1 AAA family ATPase [Actinomadura decatromicini]
MLIDRHDLVAALDRAARRKVTVVSAPAGSGKTVLLRAWAARPGQSRRVAFVTVPPDQHDAQVFWSAVLAAVREALAVGADPPPASPGTSGSALVDAVLSELGGADGPFVLIVDDLHELVSPDALDGLRSLLSRLPADVHAIVAGRRDPPLRLHRMRLDGELAEIRLAQLRFSEAETRALIAAAGLTLPDRAVALLHERTEGWAAGLRLAVLSLDGHPDPERFVAEFSGSDRTVADYLLAELLERLPSGVQRLLLRTSPLDRVNGELADLLTGASGSERTLLELEDSAAFVLSLDPERTWFRYHRLFGDLLRLELRRRQPGEIPDLHRLAAGWFVEHARFADAIRHLQAAGDWPRAARLLCDHALSLTLDGRAGTVAALLRAFPPGTADAAPELALVNTIAELNRTHLVEAAAHLEVGRSLAEAGPPEFRDRLAVTIASLDLLLARLRGDLDAIREQVDALPPVFSVRSNADIALGSDLRALALLNLGVTEAWSLRPRDGERHLTEGAALARDIGRPYLQVACLAHLGFTAVLRSVALARRRCEEAITLASRHGWGTEPVIAPALATLAGTYVWTGEFGRAREWLDRAEEAATPGSEPGVRLLLHLVAGSFHAARGDHRRALREYATAEHAQALMAGEHALAKLVTGLTAATHVRLGMTDRARTALEALDDRRADSGEIRNALAVVRLADRAPKAARRALAPVLDGAASSRLGCTLVEAHLLDALACRALGDQRAAWKAIERALDLAEPDRLVLPFALTGAWRLLEAIPPRETAHGTLITDILDAVHGGAVQAVKPAGPRPAPELSPSELRVLRYLPSNLTRSEIAGELSVSLNTVNTHIRRIYAKLGATDRSAAVRRGRELRLLSHGRS